MEHLSTCHKLCWIWLKSSHKALYYSAEALKATYAFNLYLLTFNYEPLAVFNSFHRFPQFFRMPPFPQILSLYQLEPHCVNPATSIRITNKLSLTAINHRATIPFDSSSPLSPPSRRPATFRAAISPRSFRYILASLSVPICSSRAVFASVLSTFKSFLFRGLRTLFRNASLAILFLSITSSLS